MQDVRKKAAKIKLVIFDVDGVLTDGKLFFDEQGREYKTFHTRDGFGIRQLRQTGVEVAVISGRNAPVVALRMADLGVPHVFQGQENKLIAFETLSQELSLTPEQIAHVGDDLPDLPLFLRVGLAIAVADCHHSILPYVDWRTSQPGGSGAARDVCDLIMEAQGHYSHTIERYL